MAGSTWSLAQRLRELRVCRRGGGRPVEEVRAAYFDRIPARRYGTPREYGDAVAFLASDRAAHINGTVLRVDGGMIESV